MKFDDFFDNQGNLAATNRLISTFFVRSHTRFITIVNQNLCLIFRMGFFLLLATRYQHVSLVIEDIPDFLVHEVAENTISRIKNFRLTTKILFKENQLTCIWIFKEKLELAIKNLRVCLTETIDGLLDISHHESVVAIREELQHAFLGMAIVLILIYHHFMVTVTVASCHLWIILQNTDSKMGNIWEFKSIFLNLCL